MMFWSCLSVHVRGRGGWAPYRAPVPFSKFVTNVLYLAAKITFLPERANDKGHETFQLLNFILQLNTSISFCELPVLLECTKFRASVLCVLLLLPDVAVTCISSQLELHNVWMYVLLMIIKV